MKKYAFFGGSFNPPTYAHLEIAKIAMKELCLDKVFFVPVGNSYNKPDLMDEMDRYMMLKLMCEDEENIDVEGIELNRDKGLRAHQALNEIEEKYNTSENYYIMGADNFIRLPNWDNAEEMLKKYNFVVFNRGDIRFDWNEKNVRVFELKEYKNCSSGIVRDLIKQLKYKEAEQYTKKNIINYLQKT